MSIAEIVKPAHKLIKDYYAELQRYADQGVSHELALRPAFQNLLADAARLRKWTLVLEQSVKVNGRSVRPDGTLRDEWQLPHGYWEAKDTADDLDTEIRKKRDHGYPFNNILFEDTRHAVLFQHGSETLRADLRDPQQLADLLNQFFSYAEPNIDDFEHAVDQFKDRIPDLARGLNERIKAAHQDNPAFQTAFEGFYTLCQESLNPNISRDAVDEMLIQHLLTERLMRTVFDMPEFVQRNVIAREVETVITALTSQSFNRREFLGALGHFYDAIENAARRLYDFSEKQHFLDRIYERFFQGYSVKLADTHGIVYTPQEIVDFMCAAVEEVLAAEFGLGLGDEGVQMLDPCTGTGNFIVNLLRRIDPRDLLRVYRQQLFANEVMLLPYYVAALNIEYAYRELSGHYEAFEGLCFADTLDLAEGRQLPLFAEKNTARVVREKAAPITVIIGNPPYNVGQLNENDNNKNRKYAVIDKRVSETYAADSRATLNTKLYDAYVKFFRWAIDRLQGRDGIVCFVSNNSFVDQIAFDGMRQHLLQDFTRIYHLDLHGNVRKNPKLSGTTHNVFGIQVGVGITVAVRSSRHSDHRLFYHRVPEFWRKEQKLGWLAACVDSHLALTGTPPPTPYPASGETGTPPPAPYPASGEIGTPPPAPYPASGEGENRKGFPPHTEIIDREREQSWQAPPEAWDKLKPLAREMRQKPTLAEDRLWQRLRKQQVPGFKFRRQQAIESYIVDFYCHEAGLIIEVDGPIHARTQEQDALRQTYLESLGYRVIRFNNEDIFEALDGVVERIAETLETSKPNPSPASGGRAASPSPLAGQGVGGGVPTPPHHTQAVELNAIPWHVLVPDARHTWLIPEHGDEFETFLPLGSKATKASTGPESGAIFKTYSLGVSTNRDSVVYDFDRATLAQRIEQFMEFYNAEVDHFKRAKIKMQDIDQFVKYDKIKWSRNLKRHLSNGDYLDFDLASIRSSLYRPFSRKYLYFADVAVDESGQFPHIFPTPDTEGENRVICCTNHSQSPFVVQISDHITDAALGGRAGQCFPFYVYEPHPLPPTPQAGRGEGRENITDWALQQFRQHYGDDTISKWDIFHYVYSLLHHPGYRERYAGNLKRDLPRLPFAPDFRAFANAGRALADLHLNYEQVQPYRLTWLYDEELPLSYRVEKMRLHPHPTSPMHGGGEGGGSLVVNPSLTLADIPAEAYEYRLGNRSALEWVIDQYQVSKDRRSGIASDPNRRDDPEYIVRLVERVVQVSLETVKIVKGLAEQDFLENQPGDVE